MSSDDTRQRILDAAGPVFAAKGYARSTIRDICEAAQVNVAGVNYHFGDKERLYIETVKRAKLRRMHDVPLPERLPETPAAVRLSDFVRTLLTRMIGVGSDSWETQLIMREVIDPTSACRELVAEYFEPQLRCLMGILDELVPSDTPAYRRRQIAYSIVGQCLFYRVAHRVVGVMTPAQELKRHYHPQALADHISRWSLAALGHSVAPDGAVEQVKELER